MQKFNNGVSIIIPVYNAEKYLTRCINSLFSQSFKDLEYIFVIDKNSNDKSEEIIRNLISNSDKNAKIIKPEQGSGAGYNRNIGIEHVSYEFFGFCDADDYIDLDFYEKLYFNAKKYKADIAIGQVIMLDDERSKINVKVLYPSIRELYTVGEIYSVIKWNTVWDKIYLTEKFKDDFEVRFPQGVVHEDNYFMLQAAYKANKTITVPDVTYYWVRNRQSVTLNANNNAKRLSDAYYILNMVLDFLDKIDIPFEEKYKVVKLNLNTYGTLAFIAPNGYQLRNRINSAYGL